MLCHEVSVCVNLWSVTMQKGRNWFFFKVRVHSNNFRLYFFIICVYTNCWPVFCVFEFCVVFWWFLFPLCECNSFHILRVSFCDSFHILRVSPLWQFPYSESFLSWQFPYSERFLSWLFSYSESFPSVTVSIFWEFPFYIPPLPPPVGLVMFGSKMRITKVQCKHWYHEMVVRDDYVIWTDAKKWQRWGYSPSPHSTFPKIIITVNDSSLCSTNLSLEWKLGV